MNIKFLATMILAASLVACAPEGVKEGAGTEAGQAQQPGESTQVGGLEQGGVAGGSALEGAAVSYDRAAINDPNSVLAERIIYFDFDSDQISQEYTDLIAHHGKYLAANPDVSVRLEGHADERGTREYNVALGNRRAQAVRRLLLFQGANAGQISVISYGEEKPVALGHDEESWRLNRRTELVYEAN